MLRVLDLYNKVAIFQLELEARTSRTRLVKVTIFQLDCTSCGRLVLQGCDFPARAGLRAPVFRVLDLYYKVAIFQLELEACTSRVRLVLQSCDFSAGAGNLHFAH